MNKIDKILRLFAFNFESIFVHQSLDRALAATWFYVNKTWWIQ